MQLELSEVHLLTLKAFLPIHQAVRAEDGPFLSLSQMTILLITVRNCSIQHSTSVQVSGFVDRFGLQSLFRSEDTYFSLELAQKWHFGFFLLLILTHLLELKAHDSTNSQGDKIPEKQ